MSRPRSVTNLDLKIRCCSHCKVWLDFSAFTNDVSNFAGIEYRCRTCKSAWAKEYSLKNPDKIRIKAKRCRSKTKDKIQARWRRWYSQNKGHLNSTRAVRVRAKMQATPPWSERKEIAEFYAKCPKGQHVDHFYPLNGKTVSGLHVLKNLRYLPAPVNLSKSNKHPEEFHDVTMA